MQIALATSLHLNHGARLLDHRTGAPLTMQSFVPVGLLSLKAACDKAQPCAITRVHELNTIINDGSIANDDNFYDTLAQVILEDHSDIVGLMTDADSLHHTVALARRIKERARHTHLVLGGPAVTPIASGFLKRFAHIDAIFRGEAEGSFPEYIAALQAGRPPSDVAGVTWRDGESIKVNPDRKVIEDLDVLPIPDFAAYNRTSEAALYLDVGRGCPFKCAFCATAPFWERRYRMKSIARIQDEMCLLRDRWGRTHFNFSHDIFTCEKKWSHKFCEAMASANLGVTWTCSTRTDVIDPGLLEHMAAAGCVEIYYGIETGSQALQKVIDKDLDLERCRTIVKATRAAGIRPVTGFIVGYPEETETTLTDTLSRFFDFLQVGDHRAHIFTLCPFPGAPMFGRTGATPERRAEYLDLPLTDAPAAEANGLIDNHPDMFVSHFRFATPGVEAALVDATEEISAHIVLLKRIWPHLLPHYDTPLTLFRRWVGWIFERNASRPWRAPHHGNAADLVDFIAEEMAALNISDGKIHDLLRYEALKLAAAGLPDTGSSADPEIVSPFFSAAPRRAMPFLIAAFENDISGLVSGIERAVETIPIGPQWVVFARESAGTVNTHVVGEAARRVLEHARTPRSLHDLVRVALLDTVPPDSTEFKRGLQTIQTLTTSRLLQEVIS